MYLLYTCMYIYTIESTLYILPQNSTIDLILKTVLPIFFQPEAITYTYTPLYKHRGYWDYLLSTCAEFSEKLTIFLRIRGVEILAFRKTLRTYLADGLIVFS